jgi:hypothetical protein
MRSGFVPRCHCRQRDQRSGNFPVDFLAVSPPIMSFSTLPRSLLLLSLGIALGATTTYLLSKHTQTSQSTITIRTPRPQDDDQTNLTEDIVDGIEGLIGNTKLVRIRSLSLATGCEILAKAEVLLHPCLPASLPPLKFLTDLTFSSSTQAAPPKTA